MGAAATPEEMHELIAIAAEHESIAMWETTEPGARNDQHGVEFSEWSDLEHNLVVTCGDIPTSQPFDGTDTATDMEVLHDISAHVTMPNWCSDMLHFFTSGTDDG